MYLYIPNMKHFCFMSTQTTLKYPVHKQSSILPMKLANLLPNKQMNPTQQFPFWKDDTQLDENFSSFYRTSTVPLHVQKNLL